MNEHTFQRVADIVSARVKEEFDLDQEGSSPSQIAEILHDMIDLDHEVANAIAYQETVVLVVDEHGDTIPDGKGRKLTKQVTIPHEVIPRIATAFSCNEDLLSALITGASMEVLEQTLRDSVSMLNVDACPYCAECAERSEHALACADHDEIINLCLDVLRHEEVVPNDEFEEDVREMAQALDEEALRNELIPSYEANDLLAVYAELDESARQRVRAYAYQEAARAAGDSFEQHAAYALLREKQASPFLKKVLDVIASTERGEITRSDLLKRLDLTNPRGLSRLPQALNAAMAASAKSGYELAVPPLVIAEAGVDQIFRMNAEALLAWRSLLAATSKTHDLQAF
jgi:hypothetical protein